MLPPGHVRHAGDTAAMVAARIRFLTSRVFEPIADVVDTHTVAALGRVRPRCRARAVLDSGGGSGYYLDRALAAARRAGLKPWGALSDVSVFAVRRAARLFPRETVVRADVWREIPFADQSIDVCLVVFAPRNSDELARVLRPGGTLLVVTPGPYHLYELVNAVDGLRVAEYKQEQLRASLAHRFARRASSALTLACNLTHQQACDAIAMGPTAHHLDVDEISRLLGQARCRINVTIDVRFDLFQPG